MYDADVAERETLRVLLYSDDRDVRAAVMSDSVVVDCDTCLVRSAAACGDCVVTVLLGAPPEGVVLAETEVTALDVLAKEGLVPPLRLVTPLTSPDVEAS